MRDLFRSRRAPIARQRWPLTRRGTMFSVFLIVGAVLAVFSIATVWGR